MLVASYAPHPAADLLWSSRKFRSLWAIANDWHADREDRLDYLVRYGMRTYIVGASIVEDFVSIEVFVDEALLPRTSAAREFKLHITLGFESDYGAGIARDAVIRINERWKGREVNLQLQRWTSGGTVELAWYEELAKDPDVHWLHSRGYYGNGIRIDSRQLHISL
jgi:hypothetical protein